MSNNICDYTGSSDSKTKLINTKLFFILNCQVIVTNTGYYITRGFSKVLEQEQQMQRQPW